jgi:hypothetical protein
MENANSNQGHGSGNSGPGAGGDDRYQGRGHQVTIVINGRPKTWPKGEISYAEVVALAALPLPPGEDPGFTVTYRSGHGNKPEGTLTEGHAVEVKDGMIFNVTPTNRS